MIGDPCFSRAVRPTKDSPDVQAHFAYRISSSIALRFRPARHRYFLSVRAAQSRVDIPLWNRWYDGAASQIQTQILQRTLSFLSLLMISLSRFL